MPVRGNKGGSHGSKNNSQGAPQKPSGHALPRLDGVATPEEVIPAWKILDDNYHTSSATDTRARPLFLASLAVILLASATPPPLARLVENRTDAAYGASAHSYPAGQQCCRVHITVLDCTLLPRQEMMTGPGVVNNVRQPTRCVSTSEGHACNHESKCVPLCVWTRAELSLSMICRLSKCNRNLYMEREAAESEPDRRRCPRGLQDLAEYLPSSSQPDRHHGRIQGR